MLYALIIGLVLGVALLTFPFSLGYDTREKVLKAKWFGLSFAKGLRRKKPRKTPRERKSKKKADKTIWRTLLADRGLALEVLKKTARFIINLGRTLSFRNTEISLSLPDPAWNGVLCGVLTNLDLQDIYLSVNFYNQNYAKLWIKFYPYRVVWQVVAFLIRLPGVRIVKVLYKLYKQKKAK
jgi:hypothetical protein